MTNSVRNERGKNACKFILSALVSAFLSVQIKINNYAYVERLLIAVLGNT